MDSRFRGDDVHGVNLRGAGESGKGPADWRAAADVRKTPPRLAGRRVDVVAADVKQDSAIARPGHVAKHV